jgi:phosphoenolpyruvate-protein kinase (PTS system EI component)
VVLLLGLGFRIFSVGPPAIPLVKWVIRSVPLKAARDAAEAALGARDPQDVDAALREVVGAHIDLRLVDPHSALPGRGRVVSLPHS